MNKTNDMNARHWWSGSFPAGILALFFPLLFLFAGVIPVAAAPVSNVTLTKHNLSKSNNIAGAVKTSASSTKPDQVCVFCHTPHAATAGVSPLWNKSVNAASAYTGYTSLSMDANGGGFKTDDTKGRPAGGSLLCLSCHDGTLALGTVGVLNAQQNVTISLDNTNAGKMPIVTGSITDNTTTGFTRVIGQNLSNDHPISVTYNEDLADADGELRHMDTTSQVYSFTDTNNGNATVNVVGLRTRTMKPQYPLLNTGTSGAGQIQCPTCHDPHLYDSADSKRKFLRGNRLQAVLPNGGDYNKDNDILCLACHDKMGTEWSNSIHAVSTVPYTDTAANLREFPTGTQVWKAACLNCHDTHTVSGARRLLREGTDDTNTPKKGGNSAMEETCYQCHTAVTTAVSGEVAANSQASALTLPTFTSSAGVPNIKTEFLRRIRMPIITGDQGGGGNTTEVHDITNADFIESQLNLGQGAVTNRHVECTDCHNPHRVIKNSKFDASGSTTQRTHTAGGTVGDFAVESDGNVASGVLRGAWGVEPDYSAISFSAADSWPASPTYRVVKGVSGAGTAKSSTWLTREYQLCLKCHSNYANTNGAFPALRGTVDGGTPNPTNGLTAYTNVAAEFAVNATDLPTGSKDQGEFGENTTYSTNNDGQAIEPTGSYPGNTNSGEMTGGAGVNHRSWHPVLWPTGRTRDERRMWPAATDNGNFRPPFNSRVGTQTMHCSDCHGHYASDTNRSWTPGSGPDLTKVQGPHGSASNFLLRGVWDNTVTIGGSGLCFNCHAPSAGNRDTIGDGAAGPSGFNYVDTDAGGGHGNNHGGKQCLRCHIAVPHGWKNKAFLINLNCVGAEAGGTYTGCQSHASNTVSQEPYYLGAMLRIRTWAASGNWGAGNCGKSGSTGKAWMESVCKDGS